MLVRAICFDYGGTLDGAGSHWLERFARGYRDAGLILPRARVEAAFGHATRCAYADVGVADLGLEALVAFHVARQMECLGLTDRAVATAVTQEFVRASRQALAESRAVLGRLRRHAALGVVSNFYGNVARILDEAGLAPLLGAVIDSSCVGVSKPDARIFALAVEQLGCAPEETLYVGDSFEKDVVGAHAAGLRTGWLTGPSERTCPDPELVDVRLRSLADLEALVG
jgi:HAD superfamily hydrolase (TIGR01549 family)